MALAATVFLLVPRDRNKAWFLNSEEQQIQRERMKESDGGQVITFRTSLDALIT
jgi:hypothetical protein